jgi:hypothetical protein
VPDEFQVGMLKDRPQRDGADIACTAMDDPVAHAYLLSPRLLTDRRFASNRDLSAVSMGYEAFFCAGGA